MLNLKDEKIFFSNIPNGSVESSKCIYEVSVFAFFTNYYVFYRYINLSILNMS